MGVTMIEKEGYGYRWIAAQNIKHYEAKLEENEKQYQMLQNLLEQERRKLQELQGD